MSFFFEISQVFDFPLYFHHESAYTIYSVLVV